MAGHLLHIPTASSQKNHWHSHESFTLTAEKSDSRNPFHDSSFSCTAFFCKMLPSLQYVHTRPDRRWRLLPAVHTYRDIIVLLVFSHESDHIQYGVERWGDVVIGPVHIMELCYPASFLQWDIRRDIFKRVEVKCVGDILFNIRSSNFKLHNDDMDTFISYVIAWDVNLIVWFCVHVSSCEIYHNQKNTVK